jgi:hypothetical protein
MTDEQLTKIQERSMRSCFTPADEALEMVLEIQRLRALLPENECPNCGWHASLERTHAEAERDVDIGIEDKHTPGEWWYEQAIDGGGNPVPYEYVICVDELDGTIGEFYNEGDARVAAAAPELLAACEACADWFADHQDSGTFVIDGDGFAAAQNARDAIAKAKGANTE